MNPYAAPRSESDDPLAAPGGWQVSGGRLRFRDGARLPEIDLATGSAGGDLTPASMEFASASRGMGILQRWGWLPILVGIVFLGPDLDAALMPVAILLALTWGLVGRLLFRRWMKRARLSWHVETGPEMRRLRVSRWIGRCVLVSVALFIAAVTLERDEWLPLVLLFFIASLIAQAIASRKSLQLRCVGERDGWFDLAGVPREALEVLGRLQGIAAMEAAREDRPMRLRKVFMFYLHRCSLRVLIGDSRWNPMIVIITLILKLTRSRAFERECFAHSEASELKGRAWDPVLRAKWETIQEMDVLKGWRLLRAAELDCPVGDLMTQWFHLVSQGGEHCLTIMVARVVNARAGKEVIEYSLRTPTADGGSLMTSNLWLQKPHQAGLRFRRLAGSLDRVISGHLQTTKDCRPAGLSFPEGWTQWMEEDGEKRHALLEEAGIHGPIEEREFPVSG